ncbi:NAD(P)H-hydrate dehydratase [Gramella sp. AN32]|uniref:Bifunctional NAD(P)H-hydrate repair enzyme n=1 Tax=Christiangramia antarctica TaxID=2058158 RepID=A0ABW5X9Z9_9FLAO|nr:NAD(P)H-hydrate dehydratase [Gramella sp. AN32]MCM4157391.1 bifunctional ADP-dependent NAD(P)H-hydrate dehydratase/NAD(P)H-hydrate epimerase [Gramella sp. AN32]
MKILTAAQIAEGDRITIERQGITSEELMERAGTLIFKQIHNRLQGAQIPVKIFCGIGNNGGDGLVVARHLVQHGYTVEVYVVNYTDKRSDDFLNNYEKFKETTKDWPQLIKEEDGIPEIDQGDFVIDAIFGIGLNRKIKGWMCKLIERINKSGAFVLAIDMPSGLFPDKISQSDAIVHADYTLSFQNPKLSFFLPDTMDYVGEFQVLDIAIDRQYLAEVKSETFLVGKEQAKILYKPRKPNSHKGDYGNILVAGGSYGKMGSVLLTATAAMHTGTGLCTLYIPESGYTIIQTGLPEAMVITDKNAKILSDFPKNFKADTVCFGPGAGTAEETVHSLENFLKKQKTPMLIDADGLNILSQHKGLQDLLPENSILTPHPGELKRLLGKWKDDIEKLKLAKEFSKKYKVIIVIKGTHTMIINRDEIYINTSGNPGMATAGSGDVLSGVITSLLGQKYDPPVAAVLGVYLHGLCGDIIAADEGFEGLTAGMIAQNMGSAFKALFENQEIA